MLDFINYSALSFDCYGTLIDWETGILEALAPIFDQHGISIPSDKTLELYGDFESEIEQDNGFIMYKDVLKKVIANFGRMYGFIPSLQEIDEFSVCVKQWPPFPDSMEALKALQQSYRLVIVSNIDDDLFAASEKKLGIRFDEVITAQQVRAYKPSHDHFLEMLHRLKLDKSQVLHVAQSLFHDIKPAGDLGFSTVWVNRRHDRPGQGATPKSQAVPDLEVQDLKSLAEMANPF